MKRYIVVYTQSDNLEPSIFLVASNNLPKYLEDNLDNSIILWEDFDIDNPKDCGNNIIPNDAVSFLERSGITELSGNQSILVKEIPLDDEFDFIN